MRRLKKKSILPVLVILAWSVSSALASSGSDKTYEQLKILIEVLGQIQDNYVDESNTHKLIYGAATGMVRTLDAFSQFMDPESHREIKTETEGQFGGIGIRLGLKDDWLTVITPLPGTPAYRLGLLPNDRIAEIDGETTKDLSLSNALKKLRGAPGTTVKLLVLRGSEEGGDGSWASREFTVVREIIKIESIQSRKLDGTIGYLRIIEFTARTGDDMLEALKGLKREGVTSLVLDLRNNPGGLLSTAVDVASAFIGDSKLIVYTQGRRPDSRQDFRSGPKAPYAQMPLVVLVNEGSASGAEIVAGALQDYRRAVIMGMQTYGKASVQSVIPLPDSSGLRLTVARYYTPAGRSIHRNEKSKLGGITPDILVAISKEIEAKLYVQAELIYAQAKKPQSMVKKEELVKDETLNRAVELLKAREALTSLGIKEG
jgi:carboxyl-terminal processing protease